MSKEERGEQGEGCVSVPLEEAHGEEIGVGIYGIAVAPEPVMLHRRYAEKHVESHHQPAHA